MPAPGLPEPPRKGITRRYPVFSQQMALADIRIIPKQGGWRWTMRVIKIRRVIDRTLAAIARRDAEGRGSSAERARRRRAKTGARRSARAPKKGGVSVGKHWTVAVHKNLSPA